MNRRGTEENRGGGTEKDQQDIVNRRGTKGTGLRTEVRDQVPADRVPVWSVVVSTASTGGVPATLLFPECPFFQEIVIKIDIPASKLMLLPMNSTRP
jgi:hypothetical protein